MASNILLNTFILIFILFFISSLNYSGGVHGMSLKEDLNEEHNNPGGQKIWQLMRTGRKGKVMRKMLGNEEGILMDYNEPSANPSHEPRRGTPGGRP